MINNDMENIEVETIENMQPDVKLIFLKIREQLQDPRHPLAMIVRKFQDLFTKEVDREKGQELRRINSNSQLNNTINDFQDLGSAYHESEDSVVEQNLRDFADDYIDQVKQFMQILYGTCCRFYSTVVEWDFLQQMKEDLVERLTSMLFNDESFSGTVLGLCRELTREQERDYLRRVKEVQGILPLHVGISPFLTLDRTSNIVEQFEKYNLAMSEESCEQLKRNKQVSDMAKAIEGATQENDWEIVNR